MPHFRIMKIIPIIYSLLLSFILPDILLVSSSKNSINIGRSSLSSGIVKLLSKRYEKATKLAKAEQEVDDVNAKYIATALNHASSTTQRRLIVLPLDDQFDPPMGMFSHGHIQTGDKMSLPKIFWDAIQLNKAEVPWLFQVSRVNSERVKEKNLGSLSSKEEKEFSEDDDEDDVEDDEAIENEEEKNSKNLEPGAPQSMEPLDSVIGGPLDFRAPPNYIFLPHWMMRALGLKPREVVDVSMVTNIQSGGVAKLRPLSSKTMQEIANPQAVLETELRHYSSLTKGSTIAFDYNNKRYWFEVAQVRSSLRGEKQKCIKVQDCDIRTDFLPAKDTLNKKKRKKN